MLRTWLLAIVAGCAGADAMTLQPPASAVALEPQPSELGLYPGEAMAFEVRLAGVSAGEAQLAVGQIDELDGNRSLVVRSRAATVGAAALLKHISDEATTVVDVGSGRPLTLESRLENGGNRTTASTTFAGNIATLTFQRPTDKAPRTTRIDFGKITVYDAHTAMAQLRGWKPARGAVRTVYVLGGRRLWRVDVSYIGEETIGSAFGNRRAIVFEGKSYRARHDTSIESTKPGRTFSVWLSDDADRVPLKVTAKTELGEIVMELTDYTR